MSAQEEMAGLIAKNIELQERIWALEKALRLAHEWIDPTEIPDADYTVIRAALAPSSPPSATE